MNARNDITGFFDARCGKCGTKIGWYGKLADRPPCPKCSHIETVNLSEVQKAFLDGDCFCMIQTLLYEYMDKLSETEKTFIVNMHKKHQAKESYDDIQIGSIKRIYKKLMR